MKYLFGITLGMCTFFSTYLAADNDDRRYLLKTAFLGEEFCLEGNRFSPDSTLEGAAFMSSCRPFSGQIFKIEKANVPGYFLLKTDFLGDAYCLEGNAFSPDSTLNGAAFMAPCDRPATGQLWRFDRQRRGYVLLKTLFQGDGNCLEGNRFAPTSTLGGAAFMAPCDRPASGQLWKLEKF
ncbi:MAG: hypothetical protein ACOH5I_23115 [Oligoflexus sp.]